MTRRLSFTVQREPIVLDIGGEEFTAPPVLPSAVLGQLIDKQATLADIDIKGSQSAAITKMLDLLAEVFDLVLTPEDGPRFRGRLMSRENPLDLHREVIPAVQALVEEYTQRPTRPSSPSANGPTTDGTGSTAGAQLAISALSTSTPEPSAT